MKTEKIEIKKEMLDIPDGSTSMKFAIVPPIAVRTYREDGHIPADDITGRIVTYDVERIWNGNEYHFYLVNKDDRGVFNDLVQLSAQDVQALVNKETETLARLTKQAREDAIQGIRDARWKVTMAIKKLPWYSRLFNNF